MKYGSKWPVYAKEWDGMVITPSRLGEFEAIAKKILVNKARYQAIEAKTGVPWYMVAVLHERESNGNFNTYLGNGQPLNQRTTIVPKGRGPFASFEEGAIDALHIDGLSAVKDWRLEKILYYCETFNGLGYEGKGLPSPYVWGGTNQQKPGKYVKDGVFDPNAMDTQPGCAPILATLAKLDPTIQFVRETDRDAQTPPPPLPAPTAPPVVHTPASFEGFCIRGLLSIFVSRAMENLTAEINAKYPGKTSQNVYPDPMRVSDHGYWFSYFSNVGWLTQQARSIANRNKKVVLIGHSFGATAAIMVAQNLNNQNINVDLLCPIDPAEQYTTTIPSNVKKIVAFYQTEPGQLGQGVIKAGPGWLQANWTSRAVDYHRTEGHLAIANDPFVHAKILQAIEDLLRA